VEIELVFNFTRDSIKSIINLTFNMTCTIIPFCTHNNPEQKIRAQGKDPRKTPNLVDKRLLGGYKGSFYRK